MQGGTDVMPRGRIISFIKSNDRRQMMAEWLLERILETTLWYIVSFNFIQEQNYRVYSKLLLKRERFLLDAAKENTISTVTKLFLFLLLAFSCYTYFASCSPSLLTFISIFTAFSCFTYFVAYSSSLDSWQDAMKLCQLKHFHPSR